MENGDSPVSKDHRGIPIFSVPAFPLAGFHASTRREDGRHGGDPGLRFLPMTL